MEERIRHLLGQFVAGDVSKLSATDDLYEVGGLTSFASVQLMLALEETFDVEFPETMLKRRTFGSIAAIRDAMNELCLEKA